MEIERKFLVKKEQMPIPMNGRDIRQGYVALHEDGTEVRIRDIDGEYILTVKSGGGMQRMEEEISVSADDFENLWQFTAGRRIEKVRYELPLDSGLICELDVFSGGLRGLVLAEVEFPSESAALGFSAPGWFGEEVTEDSRYKNKNLAVRGL